MAIKDLIQQHKNKVVNIAVIIITLTFAINVFKNQRANIAQLKAQKDTEAKKNVVLKDILQIEQKFITLKNVINKKEVSTIISKVGEIAKDSAVKIASLKPQTERDYPVYIKYSFDLVVSASDYHGIARFINKLERSSDIYIIDSINISPMQEKNREYKRRATLTLSTILIKD